MLCVVVSIVVSCFCGVLCGACYVLFVVCCVGCVIVFGVSDVCCVVVGVC